MPRAEPTDPAVPGPLSASGAVNDPAAPGAPAAEGAAAPDAARGGALVSPIQAGSPGSVRSGGATVGGPTGPPTTKPGKQAELDESEGPDTGFSSALPYKQSGAEAQEDGEVGRVLVGLPEAIGDEDARDLLVPLAAGLLLFVFAMHALYASRRAGAEAALLETE